MRNLVLQRSARKQRKTHSRLKKTISYRILQQRPLVFKHRHLMYRDVDVFRPRTRAECGMERPCPFVGCKYHLYLDVTDKGSIVLNQPEIDVCDLSHSCALDIVDNLKNGKSGLTLEEVGDILSLTRERVRQIEVQSLGKMWRRLGKDFFRS